MIAVPAGRRQALRPLFPTDRPGPQTGLHVIHTGHGRCWVDRLPDPRVAIARVGYDVQMRGDPAALAGDDLLSLELGHVGVEAPEGFLPHLRQTYGEPGVWERVIIRVTGASIPTPEGAVLRRLRAGDEALLAALDESCQWISGSYDGPGPLVRAGLSFGAFADGRLVSVAVPFTTGERFEDLGVVTQPEFRGRGLSPACAARVVEDVHRRGREASWSTSADNRASLRVAEKLGSVLEHHHVLYVINGPIPA